MRQKAAHLPHRSVLKISGPDTDKFLGDLITNTLPEDGEAAFAGLLTPQGKILFDFLLLKTPEGVLLDINADLTSDCIKRFSMYKLRANVNIEDVSSRYKVYAIWSEDPDQPAEEPSGDFSFPDPRDHSMGYRLLSEQSDVEGLELAPAEEYEQFRIARALPEGGADYGYSENFPHDACYDELNGVNFKKGCYVGQEVVSRMKHRGTARKRILKVNCASDLPSSENEITIDGTTIGRLGSSIQNTGIALVRVDRLASALAKGHAPELDGKELTLTPPPWANFSIEQFAK